MLNKSCELCVHKQVCKNKEDRIKYEEIINCFHECLNEEFDECFTLSLECRNYKIQGFPVQFNSGMRSVVGL